MLVAAPRSTDSTPASHLDTHDPSGPVPTLFRHTRREQWGLGVVIRKLDDRVRIQFQDGRLRTFKRGYYHLIDAVDRPLDVTLRLVEALEAMTDEGRQPRSGTERRPVSMDEQIACFRELFEGGFQDPAYARHHRGDGRKRPLKRHRDPLLEKAEALSRMAMSLHLGAADFGAIHAAAAAVVSQTDLVSAKERKAFAAIAPEHHEAIATTLYALLHGSSRLPVRFDAHVRALEAAMGKAPSWALATVVCAAAHPQAHVVVREKVLALQAVWMAPGLSVSERPMGILYERLVEMTKGVKAHLEAADLAPRDTIDVTDFMWATLRPKAQERILERRRLGTTARPTPNVAADAEAA